MRTPPAKPQTREVTLHQHTATGCYYATFPNTHGTMILKPLRAWCRSNMSLTTREFIAAIEDSRELSEDEQAQLLADFPLPAWAGK